MISSNRNPNPNLAPGFRFHPTDIELLTFYLHRKVSNLPIPIDAIAELEIYKHAPWDLPSFSPLKTLDKEWFFFSPLGRKYDRGLRPNRATKDGFWKSTGKDREIYGEEKVVGMKKILVFHCGRAPKGLRTGWVMHEYRLVEERKEEKYNDASSFVLCRVFKKSIIGKNQGDNYGACINEDETQDLVEASSDGVQSDDCEQGAKDLNSKIGQSIMDCEVLSSKLPSPSNSLLAPGFRFHPTDEELVSYYLKRKVSGLPLHIDAIAEVNLYKWSPWDLPSLSPLSLSIHNKDWYFFSALDRKYAPSRCGITNRATAKGHWKSTGNDRPVHSNFEAKIIGMKKTLVFHIGRAPQSKKTDWVMHEYRLEEDEQNYTVSSFVVCKIHKKSNHGARRTGVEPEETAQDVIPSKGTLDAPNVAIDATANVSMDSARKKNHASSDRIKQGTTTKMYRAGSQVEISYIREQIPIAWYTATVMEVVDEKILMVEYERLRNKDGTLLNEIVSIQYIRPHPPILEVRNFELLDEVEAFYNGGWWPGVVANVNTDSRYNVKFMHWEEEIEFNHTDLRLLYDWVDGQWVQASVDKSRESQNPSGPMSVGHVQFLHASNATRKCKDPDSMTSSSVCGDEKSCEFPSSSTSFENGDSDGSTIQSQQEDLQPCKKAKRGGTTEDNTSLLNPRSMESSNAVKIGHDVHTLEEGSNFRVKGLVEKCCPSSPFKNANVSSADSMLTPSSNFLLRQVEEHPHMSQRRKESVPGLCRQEKKGAGQHTTGDQRMKNCKHRKMVIQPLLEGGSMGNQRSIEAGKLPIECFSAAQCGTGNDNGSVARGLFNVMSRSSDASRASLDEISASASASNVQLRPAGNPFKPGFDKPTTRRSPLPSEKCLLHVGLY